MNFIPINIEKKILLQLVKRLGDMSDREVEVLKNVDSAVDNVGVDTLAEAIEAIANYEIDAEQDISDPIPPNKLINAGTISDDVTITLDTTTDNALSKEYMLQFDTGDTVPTITWPSSVMWIEEPEIEANHRYQVSILNDVGLIVGVELV